MDPAPLPGCCSIRLRRRGTRWSMVVCTCGYQTPLMTTDRDATELWLWHAEGRAAERRAQQ